MRSLPGDMGDMGDMGDIGDIGDPGSGARRAASGRLARVPLARYLPDQPA